MVCLVSKTNPSNIIEKKICYPCLKDLIRFIATDDPSRNRKGIEMFKVPIFKLENFKHLDHSEHLEYYNPKNYIFTFRKHPYTRIF